MAHSALQFYSWQKYKLGKKSYLENVQSKKYSADSEGILRITVISNESFRLGFKGKLAAN